MGALSNLLTGKLPVVGTPIGTGFTSPNAAPTVGIHELVFADYFQGEIGDSTRLAAMQVPAVSRARSILVSVLGRLPLVAYDAKTGVALAEQPAWLTRTSSPTPIYHRTTWTIDDLLFYGASLWTVARDGDQITEAARVPRELWSIDPHQGSILVDGKPVPAAEVLYIPGADEGLLVKGGPSIKGARAIERAWVGRAQFPIPLVEIHQITDEQMDDDEIDELVSSWAAGRTSPTGSVGFTDNRVEVRTHGEATTDLFEGARNAAVLDLARHTNIPAALLDGAQSTASLTYVTTEGKRSEFFDMSLGIYVDPIEARLSQDDVVPEGVAVRFDLSSLIRIPQPDTSPVTDD